MFIYRKPHLTMPGRRPGETAQRGRSWVATLRPLYHTERVMTMPRVKHMTPLGRTVRARLAELNMTQAELCEKVGCHPNYLLMILSGTRSGDKHLEAIHRVLGLPYRAEKGA